MACSVMANVAMADIGMAQKGQGLFTASWLFRDFARSGSFGGNLLLCFASWPDSVCRRVQGRMHEALGSGSLRNILFVNEGLFRKGTLQLHSNTCISSETSLV